MTSHTEGFYHYLGEHQQLWEAFDLSERRTIEVSEIWSKSGQGAYYTTRHRTIHQDHLPAWHEELMGEAVEGDSPTSRDCICLLVVVFITRSTRNRVDDVSAYALDQLISTFEQQLAHKFVKTSSSGIACLDRSAHGTSAHCFGVHPKLAVSWSQKAQSPTTNVICIAEQLQLDTIRQLLDYGFIQKISDRTMLPALLCAILCSSEIDRAQQEVKTKVREIEVRTGHHSWKSRNENPAMGDLLTLSARVSGCSTRVASYIRKLDLLHQLLKRLSAEDDCLQCHGLNQDISPTQKMEVLRTYVNVLVERAASQKLDSKYIESRVHTQERALLHLTAENDTLISHQLAKATGLLAAATQRDTSSMKVLAAVTVFYLPGTFVASLFSIPIVDWTTSGTTTEGGKISQVRLARYAAVTIPLMLLTFTVWGAWSSWKRHCETKLQLETVVEPPRVESQMSEVLLLQSKRRFTLDEGDDNVQLRDKPTKNLRQRLSYA